MPNIRGICRDIPEHRIESTFCIATWEANFFEVQFQNTVKKHRRKSTVNYHCYRSKMKAKDEPLA